MAVGLAVNDEGRDERDEADEVREDASCVMWMVRSTFEGRRVMVVSAYERTPCIDTNQ